MKMPSALRYVSIKATNARQRARNEQALVNYPDLPKFWPTEWPRTLAVPPSIVIIILGFRSLVDYLFDWWGTPGVLLGTVLGLPMVWIMNRAMVLWVWARVSETMTYVNAHTLGGIHELQRNPLLTDTTNLVRLLQDNAMGRYTLDEARAIIAAETVDDGDR